ncbi:hypothetical protein GCM10007160_21070 [Litchfieldella qijiaojingensis]|uniref:FAD dependent oxidoreductase domain-containing protein n=1 Tax=Litchfieldella qijiaojingensis TaxID=980347 RepID=A0ABQ2YRY6_9GAMM|nr:FAD-binding oxidoreductase [Halomonas qijiaojingensis]GGX93315.1 hypothetical protein GCM10007160_21070 [Halomonas qijiaojingensis]
MESRCLWECTSAEAHATYPALETALDSEVCVIGAGITGLSTALHLAERSVGVTVLEAGEIPSGGSGRNVGLVNAGMWIPPDDIREALGPEVGERANAMLGNAPNEVFALIERHAIACDATRTGTLHLAPNHRGSAELARRHEQFQRRGAPVELLEGDACQALIGTRRIHGALFDKRAGTLNPTAYTRGLARIAAQAGARLHTHSPVLRVERVGDAWRVVTPSGNIKAPHVVIATNAYTRDAWNQVRRHFFGGYFYQVASGPLAGDAADRILPERQGAWDTRSVLSSIRRDAQGRLILGSLGRGETKPATFSSAGQTASSATTSPNWASSTGNEPGPVG